MGVRGRPESRTFKRNSPIIIYLLTGGGVRVVARNGEPRHAHRTTHRWWGGVLVSLYLAQSGWVCGVVGDDNRFGVPGV